MRMPIEGNLAHLAEKLIGNPNGPEAQPNVPYIVDDMKQITNDDLLRKEDRAEIRF
ncbi:unnamed protein product [Arabidopsis lyrata]|uniref:Predicted protein n=1 Tax=Arabidopsis lyrata subsp. lyrata TaxID=81972 RepID=D7MA04_ARALL|nr:predicted protein [Arabidopsis lyrata subsp. lyrata]CAH8273967.1 unnamed protein product [Arabidopsis lyrata]